MIVNQLWELFVLGNFGVWTVVAFVALAAILFQLFRPAPKFEGKDEHILDSLRRPRSRLVACCIALPWGGGVFGPRRPFLCAGFFMSMSFLAP